jgi:glycosyltransferase involved in cell wall biosynthesis
MAPTRTSIAINGRFLRQATTGVQRVAREVTRALDAIAYEGERPISLRLLCQRGANVRELGLKATVIEEIDGPDGFLWEQVALPPAVGDSYLLCLGNTAPIYSLMRRNRVALMIHDLSYRMFPNAYRRSYRHAHALVMRLLLRRADPILTVSQSEKRMLIGLLPDCLHKVTVAQNGGWRNDDDVDDINAKYRVPSGARYALYVGSLSYRKNIDGLIKVATRLAEEDNVEFVFAGSAGAILSPPNLSISTQLSDKIHFLGQIENIATLGQLYRGASCLVFPSFYEASPLPPLEAMHLGCPVVASNIPSMRERCGEAAQYCDPFNADDILRAIRSLLHDNVKAAYFVEQGHIQEARFSWRRQANQILDAILASTHSERA